MSEIRDELRADLAQAMKAGDKTRTGTIRMLLSAIIVEETQGAAHSITKDEFLKVVAREAKKRRESATIYTEAGRTELAEQENAEADVLETYLPAQMSDEDVAALVTETIKEVAGDEAPSMKMMGQIMKAASAKAAGAVDGKRLSTAVRAALA
ncbi:GatB/YqeY domain-containing protein [Corynebacterium aquilae]|uniref:Glutamyl-tRNA amidotransferase n=1 Tax=Corynebacterium aquilae DSM 44791 TaxID=1431546 RepID=A0A1L7CDG2_9CORY|nr:GatB/YqeY domain-containing protein [Corynebacterium aquilae]APT83866.1 glutamyl-tRNA amidotransferase [Corynebacterium aquilae DSM 44791]